MSRVLRSLLPLVVSASVRAWIVLGSIVHAAERIVPFFVAAEFARQEPLNALALSAPLAVIFLLRGAFRAVILRRSRAALISAAADALLRGDVLRAGGAASREADVAIFQGLYAGERLASETLPSLGGDVIACVVLGALLAVRLPMRMVALGAVAVAVAAVAIVVARRFTSRALERADRARTSVIEGIVATQAGRLELAASGSEADFLAELRAHTEQWTLAAMRADRLAAFAGRAPILAAALGVAAALLVDQAARGPLTLQSFGEAGMFIVALPVLAGVARASLDLKRAEVNLAPLVAILDAPRGPVGNGMSVPALPAVVTLRSVSFRYDQARTVLSDLDLTWAPGRVLVLQGPNGCGKSTCLRLLLGLARPAAGAVKVGERDLFDLDLSAWRRSIAYLPQRPFLPDRGTVRDAMRLIARDASDEALRVALERVDVWRALSESSPGAPLEVVASTLSMGQRQRVALARVLARDAKVYIFDEPDANLDRAGIALVAELARELAPGRMVIIAAHTPDLVAVADDVVDLRTAGT